MENSRRPVLIGCEPAERGFVPGIPVALRDVLWVPNVGFQKAPVKSETYEFSEVFATVVVDVWEVWIYNPDH